MSSEELVQVAIRVRPMIGREKLRGAGKNRSRSAVAIQEEARRITIADALADDGQEPDEQSRKQRHVSCVYDQVFGPEASQRELFEKAIVPSVQAAVSGINCTIFAYGQTGTGKTYTIMGNSEPGVDIDSEESKEGMMPMAMNLLFETLQSKLRPSSRSKSRNGNPKDNQAEESDPRPDTRECHDEPRPENHDAKDHHEEFRIDSSEVYCSYLQIYNEQLYDILQDHKRQFPLKIRQGQNGYNYVQGLAEIRVTSLSDVIQVLRRGARNRAVRATEFNESSSRSHAILQLRIETEELKGGLTESRIFRSSKFNFVDLAGSEKWDTSTEMSKSRTKELLTINQSLSSLGNVVQALGEKGRQHVPYRDSKLTHLLQDSLGGNTRTTIICTLSPAAESIEESISTLKFADRARQVMVQVKVNEVIDDSVLLAHAQAEIARLKRMLRQKNSSIENKYETRVEQLTSENRRLSEQVFHLTEELKKLHELSRDDTAYGRLEPGSSRLSTSELHSSQSILQQEATHVLPAECKTYTSTSEVEETPVQHTKQQTDASAVSLQQTVQEDADFENTCTEDKDCKSKDSLSNKEETATVEDEKESHDEEDFDDSDTSDLEDHLLSCEQEQSVGSERNLISQEQLQGPHIPETKKLSSALDLIPPQPAPSDILNALREELGNLNDRDPDEWDVEQERVLDQVEQQCFDDLSYDLEQLQKLKRERETLEEQMRQLKKGNPAPAHAGSNRSTKKKRIGRKLKHSSLKNSPLLTKPSGSAGLQPRPPKGNNLVSRPRDLEFSHKDIGKELDLYQCRVDSWYKVVVVAFDPKSGMHRMKYEDDKNEQWHQMVGRRYKLKQTEKPLSSKTLPNNQLARQGDNLGVAQREEVAFFQPKEDSSTEQDILSGLHEEGLSYN